MPGADRERWNARHAAAVIVSAPEAWLDGVRALLPASGRALDVAGGAGRHARWLVGAGFSVTLVDVSDVAVERARQTDRAVTVLRQDLERDPFPAGPWDVILCINYLQRSLFPLFLRALAPGGALVFAQATARNLERHAAPSARWLLEEDETATLLGGFDVAWRFEGWTPEGRHEARVVARRPRG